jgi:predicted RNA methylase
MLVLAELRPGDVLYDLGSGDGRVVIMAAREFGAKSIGVELRDDLVKRALNNVSELKLDRSVQIIHKDIFDVDLTSADVVFLYLTTSANTKIKLKLEAELKLGARIISHDYEILGWKHLKVDNFCETPSRGFPSHTIYLYKR